MELSATLDHTVVVVDDLPVAKAELERLGFNVVMGGVNGPAENVLVVFSDGSYIEFITTAKTGLRKFLRALAGFGLLGATAMLFPKPMRRYMRWFGLPAGPIDWCLATGDLDATLRELESSGIAVTKAFATRRTRPDGVVAEWRLGSPNELSLPFLIEDETHRRIRVPIEYASHPNGAIGFHHVTVSENTLRSLGENFSSAIVQLSVDGPSGAQGFTVQSRPADDQAPFNFALRFPDEIAMELIVPSGAVSSFSLEVSS